MDLGMPHMSSAHLLHELRSIAPKIPIVAVTGYVEPGVYVDVVEAGVQKIIPKPFEIAELLKVLRDVL
jgi:CheY-like chemotaxis protein